MASEVNYLRHLDPRQDDDADVLESIRTGIDKGHFSPKDISKFTTYAVSTISQVLSGKYATDPTEIIKGMGRFLRVRAAKQSVLQTVALEDMQATIEWAWKRRLIGLVAGENGQGKTVAAQSYCIAHPEYTAYIILNKITRTIDALKVIAESVGITGDMKGPASWVHAAIVRELQRKNKLIIIDEADRIKPELLSVLQTLYGDNEERCAIVLVGTPALIGELQRNDLKYMWRRISLKCTTKELKESEALALINQYDHSLERSEMRELYTLASSMEKQVGAINVLSKILARAFDSAQLNGKEEIDMECIEEGKARVLGGGKR